MGKLSIGVIFALLLVVGTIYWGNKTNPVEKLQGGWRGFYSSEFLNLRISALYFSNDSIVINRENSIESTHKWVIRNDLIWIYSDSLPVSIGNYGFIDDRNHLGFKDCYSFFYRDSTYKPYQFKYVNIPLGIITHANKISYVSNLKEINEIKQASTLSIFLVKKNNNLHFQINPEGRKFNIGDLPAILRKDKPVSTLLIHTGAEIDMEDVTQIYLCLFSAGIKWEIEWILGRVDNERYYIFKDKPTQFWKEDIEKPVYVLSESSHFHPLRRQVLQTVNTIIKIETENDIKALTSLNYNQKYLISYSSKMKFSDYIKAQTELQKMSGKSVITEIRLE